MLKPEMPSKEQMRQTRESTTQITAPPHPVIPFADYSTCVWPHTQCTGLTFLNQTHENCRFAHAITLITASVHVRRTAPATQRCFVNAFLPSVCYVTVPVAQTSATEPNIRTRILSLFTDFAHGACLQSSSSFHVRCNDKIEGFQWFSAAFFINETIQ